MGKRKASGASRNTGPVRDAELRIIGGAFRRSVIAYSGDPRTRPMKDRVREAAFNLLADRVKGRDILDLFAGTGALGLEALSRGAAHATFIERHYPTGRLIEQNLRTLGISDRGSVFSSDTFFWVHHEWQPGSRPLLVFCSPPYDYFVTRREQIIELITRLVERAPAGSTLIVESDDRFDSRCIGGAEHWFVRAYPPAVLAITDLPWNA